MLWKKKKLFFTYHVKWKSALDSCMALGWWLVVWVGKRDTFGLSRLTKSSHFYSSRHLTQWTHLKVPTVGEWLTSEPLKHQLVRSWWNFRDDLNSGLVSRCSCSHSWWRNLRLLKTCSVGTWVPRVLQTGRILFRGWRGSLMIQIAWTQGWLDWQECYFFWTWMLVAATYWKFYS